MFSHNANSCKQTNNKLQSPYYYLTYYYSVCGLIYYLCNTLNIRCESEFINNSLAVNITPTTISCVKLASKGNDCKNNVSSR